MTIIIKVENNLLEILEHLESLGMVWCSGETPTQGITNFKQRCCSFICINNNVITWGCTSVKSISLEEFKIRYLNGILLEPGMAIEDDTDKIVVVIPHKSQYIAFVSYSKANSWSVSLNKVLHGNVRKIYDIPSDFVIHGNVLWEAKKITLNNQPSSKEKIIEKIRNYSGNIKVTLE
jgi:hypothetical protein